MPNQYAKVKNAVKGEDDIQDHPPIYGFIDEFLEDARSKPQKNTITSHKQELQLNC
jgi:hypothetical protein